MHGKTYSYKNIPVWVNLRRQKILKEFKNNVHSYFTCRYEAITGHYLGETALTTEYRDNINLQHHQAYLALKAAGIQPIMQYAPPEALGGWKGPMDLMHNIFLLEQKRVDHNHLIDMIDKAIGVYKSDKTNAYIRTFNPLFWLLMVIDYIVSIPFALLGRIGFDRSKIEYSFIGKSVKVIIYLVFFIHAILGILQILGYEGWVRKFLSLG